MTEKELYFLLLQEFRESTKQTKWNPSVEYEGQFLFLLQGVGYSVLLNEEFRHKKLVGLLNKKLDINATKIKAFIDIAFTYGLLFNYHQKTTICSAFDNNDINQLKQLLIELSTSKSDVDSLLKFFHPLSKVETINKTVELLDGDADKNEVLSALWGGYLYLCFEETAVHRYFLGKEDVCVDFFEFLTKNYAKNLARNLGLRYLKIDASLLSKYETEDAFLNSLMNYIRDSYEKLSNHTYLSILIKSDVCPKTAWTIYGKAVLYAEKFKSSKTKIGYFHPNKIAEQTKGYISELKIDQCDFSKLNEGFTYKDCIILTPTVFENGKTEYSFQNYDTLILFEKNERDETVIPCPACRSKNVRGNSYPTLGVKSWECNNIICPDRSKYNRGKRYSLASLIKQEAIDNDVNQIDLEHLKKWRLDVTSINNEGEVVELLLKHYTLYGDKAEFSNVSLTDENLFGRVLIDHKFESHNHVENELSFFQSPFFNRFLASNDRPAEKNHFENLSDLKGVELYGGDCYDVLRTMPSDIFDGAVTSPPYYNAKDYSQWSNMYCYLYDMYNIAREVYRTLKAGSPFLFNIFDYFDNENTAVFSAMGDKRMILGSYIIEIFERVGFQVVDNIIWHKGEIQGKRNFNQGNNSPYYQAPLNCYEHVFLFSKGKPNFDTNYPKILKAKPVIKMVRGVNKLGHDAPYPLDIPDLLFKLIPKGSSVLDPFAGSMTTARACYQNGYHSVSIEYMPEYCKLGLKILHEDLGLFAPTFSDSIVCH